MRIAHKALRRLHENDRSQGLPQELVSRIRRILGTLRVATKPADVDLPGYRLHPLRGDRTGWWGIRVSSNWRIVFRFRDDEPVDVDLIDYH